MTTNMTMNDPKPFLASATKQEIAAALKAAGQPGYRADQVYDWIVKKWIVDPALMTNLSASAKEALSAAFLCPSVAIEAEYPADDGSAKYLLRLHDGETIECARSKVAPESVRAAGTEHAGDGTADLRAQAERHPSILGGNAGAFDGFAVVKPEQVLRGTVVGGVFRLDRDGCAQKCLRKGFLRGGGKVGHERGIDDPFFYDPVVHLGGAVCGLSGGFQRRGDVLFGGGRQKCGSRFIRSRSRRHRKAPF